MDSDETICGDDDLGVRLELFFDRKEKIVGGWLCVRGSAQHSLRQSRSPPLTLASASRREFKKIIITLAVQI
jgi:hypothetical protein